MYYKTIEEKGYLLKRQLVGIDIFFDDKELLQSSSLLESLSTVLQNQIHNYDSQSLCLFTFLGNARSVTSLETFRCQKKKKCKYETIRNAVNIIRCVQTSGQYHFFP